MGYILNKETLVSVSNNLKSNGYLTVLTIGAFDLLHEGHVKVLEESKKLGHALIVGLESDERIATYKDPARPVLPLNQRLKIIASIGYVDFIFAVTGAFDEKDYVRIYSEFNPMFVTYGSNYGGESRIQKDLRNGSEVTFKKVLKKAVKENEVRVSTTGIISKIRSVS